MGAIKVRRLQKNINVGHSGDAISFYIIKFIFDRTQKYI